MRMPNAVAVAPPASVRGGISDSQRKCSCGGTCAQCRGGQPDEEHAHVRRKPTGPQLSAVGTSSRGSGLTAPPAVHEALHSPGRPLDSATRAFMEPRFGYDFSSVRVHTGGAARRSAADLDAVAYTVGPHVVLNTESPSPKLLAHELAHVVQQASAPAPLLQRGPNDKKGDTKFFDPSRGPMTDAEKAKLLAVRKSFNLPDTPTTTDSSIVGILVTETGEEIPFHSGEFGGYEGGVRPADVKRGPGSGTNRINRTHVETWAANAMRKRGLKRAVLLIELEPCAVCGGYGKGKPAVDTKVPGVAAQLPEDAQLIVVDTEAATYFRQTPTDPQKPTTKVTPKPAGGGSGGKSQKKTTGDPAVDNPPAGGGTSKSPPVKGQGGGKASPGTDVEPAAPAKTGGTSPAPKTGGTSSKAGGGGGGASGLAIHVAANIATLGLDWLASYLKAKVDQKIAAQQIDAFMAFAAKQINAKPDDAVKKMLTDPGRTLYAWVYLDNSVVMSQGSDPYGDPILTDSSPMVDLAGIDYQFMPADASMIAPVPMLSGGGHHITVTRRIIIDVALQTPPLEDLIAYAKSRNLPLDDLLLYVYDRQQSDYRPYLTALEARATILTAYNNSNNIFQILQTQFHLAQKHHDVPRQKQLSEALLSVGQSLVSITDQLKPIDEMIQKYQQKVDYWKHILDLIQPTKP